MGSSGVKVELPRELADAIDSLVGAEGRSAFIAQTAQAELKRRIGDAAEKEERRQRLIAFLRSDEPAWRDEDHPDLVAEGTAAWVRNRRQADEALRQARLDEHEVKLKEAV